MCGLIVQTLVTLCNIQVVSQAGSLASVQSLRRPVWPRGLLAVDMAETEIVIADVVYADSGEVIPMSAAADPKAKKEPEPTAFQWMLMLIALIGGSAFGLAVPVRPPATCRQSL